MKKYFLFLILLICLLFSLTKSSLNREEIVNLFVQNNNYLINYPQSSNKEIDDFIEEEIMDLCQRIIDNYYPKKVFLNSNYEIYRNKNFLSYFFKINVKDNNKVIKVINKTYNFDFKKMDQIVLNDFIIQNIYLELLNKELAQEELKLTIYDLNLISYIITNDYIMFIIPEEISAGDEKKIQIRNMGVSYLKMEQEEVGSRKLVALTFDDGPSSKTKEIVDLLGKYNIKATFFLLGERIKYYEDEVLYLLENQHEIGNHSYSHPDFADLSLSEQRLEIEKTQKEIQALTKTYPKLFRFPYGSYNKEDLDYIGLPIILWNVDSEDWRYQDNNLVFNKVINLIKDENIILFHDSNNYKRAAIENVIKHLDALGYEFVTVSELYDFKNIENLVNGKVYY